MICSLIVFNALFLQKDAGFIRQAAQMRAGISLAGGREAVADRSGQGDRQADLLRAIRRELAAQDYFPGRFLSGQASRGEAGVLDAMTCGAILAWQYDHHLPMTGKPSDDLLKQLLFGVSPSSPSSAVGKRLHPPARPLRLVAEIQGTLAGYGFYRGRIDGLSGEATREAIRRFERARGLPVTGRVSGLLVQELQRFAGVAFSPPL